MGNGPQASRRSAARRPRAGDGAVVRCRADSDDWWQPLPPAPLGADITVSLSSAAPGVAAGLSAHGYRCVGPEDGPGAAPVAHFLVRQALLDEHPEWWAAFAAHAERIYALAFGPVALALRDVVSVHLRPVRSG